MQPVVKSTENGFAILHVEVDAKLFDKSYKYICQRYARQIDISGFRKGNVPTNLVENSVGRETLIDDTISDLAPRTVRQAVNECELELVGTPHVERFGKEEPIVLEIKVALKPTVELVDYADLKLDFSEDDKSETQNQAQIEKSLQELRRSRGKWERTNAPTQMGDLVIISVDGQVENESILSWKKQELLLTAESKTPMIGFHTQLEGMHRGAQREFKLTVPEGYTDSTKIGKTATFKVVLKSNSRLALPELNDEFAVSLQQQDIKNLEDLRHLIDNNQRERQKMDTNNQRIEQLVEQLVELSNFQIAELLMEEELEDLVKSRQEEVAKYRIKWEDYLKTSGKTDEEFVEEMKPVAEKRVKQAVVLDALVAQETPDVPDEKVTAEVASLRANRDYSNIKRWDKVKESVRSKMEENAALENVVAKIKEQQSEQN